MTLADVLASIDVDSRNRLVEDVEDALEGHSAGEVFLVCCYFTALAISHLPRGDIDLIDDMPRILRSVIACELDTVTRQ